MTNKDKQLLEMYLKGFKHELNNQYFNIYSDPLVAIAYNLGRDHAIIGDEVQSIDNLTNEQILNLIKNGNLPT